MAAESGWWTLTTTVELDDVDREHIAKQIEDGFTSGQIAGDES